MAISKQVKMGLGLGCGCFSLGFGALVVFLIFVGYQGPSINVETGNALTAEQQEILDRLDLLDAGEKVIFYYSDALLDMEAGVYLLTDRRVVLHNQDWVTPTWKIDFHNISSVDFVRDPSFWTDSTVTLNLTSGDVIDFPLSSEAEGDMKFVERLKSYVDEVGANQ